MNYTEFIEKGGSGNAFLDKLYETFQNRDSPYCWEQFLNYHGIGAMWIFIAIYACKDHHEHKYDYSHCLRNKDEFNKLGDKIHTYIGMRIKENT